MFLAFLLFFFLKSIHHIFSFINEKQKSGLYILILDLKKNNSNNRLGHVVINKGYFDFYKTSKIRDWCVR